jgi:hypothetical protein
VAISGIYAVLNPYQDDFCLQLPSLFFIAKISVVCDLTEDVFKFNHQHCNIHNLHVLAQLVFHYVSG